MWPCQDAAILASTNQSLGVDRQVPWSEGGWPLADGGAILPPRAAQRGSSLVAGVELEIPQWGQQLCWYLHIQGNGPLSVAYRWMHYLSAAAFVGLLLVLNLLLAAGPGEGGPRIAKGLLQRVFQWWRWTALLFLFSGLNLLHMLYNFPSGNYFDDDKGLWMALGAGMGSFIWGLVWFWVGPAQQRHFEGWDACSGAGRELAPTAALGIRVITVLLPPVVMGMAVGGHGLTLFSTGWRDVAWTFAAGSLPVLGVYALGSRRRASKQKGSDAS